MKFQEGKQDRVVGFAIEEFRLSPLCREERVVEGQKGRVGKAK